MYNEIGLKSWFEVGIWLLSHVEQWSLSLGLEALRFLGPCENKSELMCRSVGDTHRVPRMS